MKQDVGMLAGLLFLVGGVGAIYPPAGAIVLGLLLMVWAFVTARSGTSTD